MPAVPRPAPPPDRVCGEVISAVASLVRGAGRPMLLLGGRALTERGLSAASRIAVATGAQLLAETFPARMEGGAGVPAVARLAYLAEQAEAQLAGVDQLILAGAGAPVAFFAYPGRGSELSPADGVITQLADPTQDAARALEQLAALVAPQAEPIVSELAGQAAGAEAADSAPLTAVRNLATTIAATLPEHAIVVDEANTSGIGLPAALAGAPRHSLLALTGGAIGQGLPVATGAAVAAPDRRVVCVEADGSALYTIQALWTQAREQLDVTTVLVNNGSYAVLRMELARVGAGRPGSGPGPCSRWPTRPRISPPSARVWACQPSGSPPPVNCGTRWSGRTPRPARGSSRRWSPPSPDRADR